MKFVLLLSIIALIAIGCSGEAKVKIYNDTNTIASGEVDGSGFSVSPGNVISKKVDVGSLFSNSSDISITTRACCSDYYGTSCRTFYEEEEMEEDYTYIYYIDCTYFGNLKQAAEPGLGLKRVEPNSNILAP